MIAKTYLNFLERNRLIGQAKNNARYFKKVINECLAPDKDQYMLIIGDQGYLGRRVAALSALGYYLAAKELGINAKLVLQKPKIRGQKADTHIINELAKLPSESVIVMNMSNKLGSLAHIGKSYRKFCKKHNHRFVSMSNVGNLKTKNLKQLINPINTDYEDLRQRSRRISDIFTKGKELYVTSQNGTEVFVNIKGMKAISNDADYRENGKGGNLPAGEAYIPPNRSKVEGKIVVDGSCTHKHGTYLLKDKIVLNVEKGKVTEIKDKTAGKLLKSTLNWAERRAKYPERIRKICEFGYGTNKHAFVVGATVIDEKALGTAHFAIGSNYWFGGDIQTFIHLDQVFKKPTVYVDGEILSW